MRVRRAVQRRTWAHGCTPRRRKEQVCGRLRAAECQRRDGGVVLVELNRGFAVAELIPGPILIGTDGGGEGVGLDLRGADCPVVLVT